MADPPKPAEIVCAKLLEAKIDGEQVMLIFDAATLTVPRSVALHLYASLCLLLE